MSPISFKDQLFGVSNEFAAIFSADWCILLHPAVIIEFILR